MDAFIEMTAPNRWSRRSVGHVALSCTQRYLTMTPELLNEAGKRFAAYAGAESCHE